MLVASTESPMTWCSFRWHPCHFLSAVVHQWLLPLDLHLPPITDVSDPAAPLLFADHGHKISSAYRFLGCFWKHGVRSALPKKMRPSVLTFHNPTLYTVIRTSKLDEVETDCLLFLVVGCDGFCKIHELKDGGVKFLTKGMLRTILSAEGWMP